MDSDMTHDLMHIAEMLMIFGIAIFIVLHVVFHG